MSRRFFNAMPNIANEKALGKLAGKFKYAYHMYLVTTIVL